MHSRRQSDTQRPSSVLPVIDIQRGQVVRGVAGERADYRPIESLWAEEPTCLAVGRGLRERFGFVEVYVADLDAIQGGDLNVCQLADLGRLGLRIMLDAGLCTRRQQQNHARKIAKAGLDGQQLDWVVGLESLSSKEDLRQLATELADRCILSIDLKAGQPLTKIASWRELSATAIAEEVIALSVSRLIVLDLASVGVGCGPQATLNDCRSIRQAHAEVELISGGGVRELTDVQTLVEAGCDRVLVASALHNGAIRPDQLEGC